MACVWDLCHNARAEPSCVLANQVGGTVVADAVMVVPSGVSTDHVTYTPTLTSVGTGGVYAK